MEGNKIESEVGRALKELYPEQPMHSSRCAANMTAILGQLRSAAPKADIVLLIPHNITIADFPNDNPLCATFDLEMRALAVANHARVADAFAGITLTGRTCELTFLCLTGDEMDSHPTDAGYAVMANLIFHAAGYDRL